MTYTWDGSQLKYRDEDGEALSDADLKRIVLFYVASYAREFERLAKRLSDGQIEIGEWQQQFADLLKRLHLAVAAIGVGGVENLTDEILDWVSSVLRRHYTYLNKFARQIENRSKYAATPEAIASRSKLYAAAANRTFEEARRLSARSWQFAMERNVLGPAEHCPECLAITAQGWQPIGTFPPPGARLCKVNCKCRLIFAIPPITEEDE